MSDRIRLYQMLSRIPVIIAALPYFVKGLKLSKITDPKTPVGTGWLLEKTSKKYPDRPAVLFDERRITYRQFNEWVNRYANYLLSIGIKKGDVIAIFMENRPEYLTCYAAIAKTGAISALINHSQTGKVLSYSINLVKPKLIIVGEEFVKSFESVKSELDIKQGSVYFVPAGDTLANTGKAPQGFINLAEVSSGCSTVNPESTNKIYIKDPLMYVYTSGTTGMPKAGITIHGRMMKGYGGFGVILARLKPKDIIYNTLPLYHTTALVVCWGAALASGAAFALRRKFSVREFWNDVRKYKATSFGYVGELCRYLMNQPEKPDDSDNTIRTIVGNGMRPSIWKPFKKRFGIKRVGEFYSVSEGNIAFVNAFDFDNTVGYCPVPYAIVKYDKETETPVRNKKGFLQKVKTGEAGLLLSEISEESPFDGYTDKSKNEASIYRDVFKKGDVWYCTGDMLRDIGFKHAQFVDRLGDTFRWKGENVSTTEVENILGEFSGIEEAAVYGVEIPETNGKAGMAAVVLSGGTNCFDCSEIYKHLSGQLPSYAVPMFIRVRSEMSTTGTFKIKKTDLKEQGYDISKFEDRCYALLPGKEEYVEMTEGILKDIKSCKYRY